jgi:hypothetical protein
MRDPIDTAISLLVEPFAVEAGEMLNAVERRVNKTLEALDKQVAGLPADTVGSVVESQNRALEALGSRQDAGRKKEADSNEQTASLIGTQQKEIERLRQRLSEYEKEAVESVMRGTQSGKRKRKSHD